MASKKKPIYRLRRIDGEIHSLKLKLAKYDLRLNELVADIEKAESAINTATQQLPLDAQELQLQTAAKKSASATAKKAKSKAKQCFRKLKARRQGR